MFVLSAVFLAEPRRHFWSFFGLPPPPQISYVNYGQPQKSIFHSSDGVRVPRESCESKYAVGLNFMMICVVVKDVCYCRKNFCLFRHMRNTKDSILFAFQNMKEHLLFVIQVMSGGIVLRILHHVHQVHDVCLI